MAAAASSHTVDRIETWITFCEKYCSKADEIRVIQTIPYLVTHEGYEQTDLLLAKLSAHLYHDNADIKALQLQALCSASVALRALRAFIDAVKQGEPPPFQGDLEYRKLHLLSALTDSECTLPFYRTHPFHTGYNASMWSHLFTGDPKTFTDSHFHILRLMDEEMRVETTSEKTTSFKFVPTQSMSLRLTATTSALQDVLVEGVIATVTSYLYCPNPNVYFFANGGTTTLYHSPWWEKPTTSSDLQPLMDAEIGLIKSQGLNPEIYCSIVTPERIKSHITTTTYKPSTFKLTGSYDEISSAITRMNARGLNPQPHRWVRATGSNYERSVTITEPIYHDQFLVVDAVTRKVTRLPAVVFKNPAEDAWDVHAVGLEAIHYLSRTMQHIDVEKDYHAIRVND